MSWERWHYIPNNEDKKTYNMGRGFNEWKLRGAAAVAGFRYCAKALCEATGLSMPTVYKHLRDGNFTRADIQGMVELFNLDPQDIYDIFFSPRNNRYLTTEEREHYRPWQDMRKQWKKQGLIDELDNIVFFDRGEDPREYSEDDDDESDK